MQHKTLLLFSLLPLLISADTGLTAPLNEWGVYVENSSTLFTSMALRPRSSFAATSRPGENVVVPGGPDVSSAFSSARLSRRNNLSLPTLRGFASSGDNAASFARSMAIDAYTFEGDEPELLTLDIRLSANVRGSGDAFAIAGVFSAEDFLGFGSGVTGFDVFESNVFLGDGTPTLSIVEGIDTDSTTLDFLATPGESFYVVAMLDVSSSNGGVVNALSTLTTELTASDPAVLESLVTASVQAIPEPSTTVILVCCVAGAVTRRRVGSA